MGVDYRVLECIRGARLDEVAKAIETSLAARGWVPGVSTVDEDRPIQLIEDGKWVVVDDRYDLASTRWAEELSATLGGDAISLRVVESEFALRRFDRGVLVGKVDNEAAMRKALERRIAGKGDARADERALDREVLVRTAFLADLASGASRAKLTAGLRFAPSDSEAALGKIAKLAKLPQPLTRHDEPQGGLQLCFRRDAAQRGSKRARVTPAGARPLNASPPLPRAENRTASVHLSHGFHVRNVNRKQLVAAMHAVLTEEGLVQTPATGHGPERRVFVTTAGKAWQSFGEVASGVGAHLVTPTRTTRGRVVPWGSALSSKLALPVLEVRASTSASTFDVWSAGEKRGQLVLRSGARQPVLDASILAPFVAAGVAKGLRSIALDFRTPLASDHQFVALWVAQEIDLEAAFPSGSLAGTILTFAAR